MTTPHPTSQPGVAPPASPTPPATGSDSSAPVRRVLTGDDLRAIHAAARAATSPAQLLHDALGALAAALHRPADPPDADTTDADAQGTDDQPAPLPNLAGYAIPATQWDAVFDAVTGRAHAWGLAAEIGLDLALNLLPTTYDNPDNPQPAPQPGPRPGTPGHPALSVLDDLWPTEHHLTLTRSAVETIAACQTHLQRLARRYHPASTAYRVAADSWTDLLAVLLTAYPDTHVNGHGHLGLLVESSGGTAWTLTYQQQARRCTATGCHAVIDDDATARAPSPDATVLDHTHVPSYPPDGPAPGRWAATY